MTLTEPSSPLAATETREPVSDAWLYAWALARSGYAARVAIGKDASAQLAGTTPQFFAHLARPVPILHLSRALESLRAKRAPDALVLVANRPKCVQYAEHLALDANDHVMRIHRAFRRQDNAPSQARRCLLGVISKSPLPGGSPWRAMRTVLRSVRAQIQAIAVPPPPPDAKAHLIDQLNPKALKALAADLGFQEVRDFCFAHPSARIDDLAHLRGPLFIEPDTNIAADHTHIGPAWLTSRCAALTLPPHFADARSRAAGAPYFVGPQTTHRPIYNFFKRSFDIAMALFVIIITLPVCLIVALIIKLYDRGPILFAHQRETLGGRPFLCLKFRTMVRNAEAIKQKLRTANQVDGPQFKIANDPRITPIGRFLRKTNIDELPQFWNVLMGEMSVVGPRPSPFEENQLCPAWREARLSVKPGITGLWQISRSRQRGAADFQEWIFYDTQYVERRSFSLDMKIVLLTIKELFGKGQ